MLLFERIVYYARCLFEFWRVRGVVGGAVEDVGALEMVAVGGSAGRARGRGVSNVVSNRSKGRGRYFLRDGLNGGVGSVGGGVVGAVGGGVGRDIGLDLQEEESVFLGARSKRGSSCDSGLE